MKKNLIKKPATIYEAFAAQAQAAGDHPAILEEAQTFSFGQLASMADLVCSGIHRKISEKDPDAGGSQSKKDSFIGVVLDHGAWMIASMFGILQANAAYVPAEPDFPIERIRFMMNESHARLIITSRKYADAFDGFPCLLIEDIQDLYNENTAFDAEPIRESALETAGENPLSWMDENHEEWSSAPAYVLYTSGSTGVPKGVLVSNANVLHYVQAFYDEFHPGYTDIMLQYSVCSFDIFVEEVFTTLLCGAALYIPSPELHEDLPALLESCARHNVTEISGFPYLLKEMDSLPLPKSIRLLISGGDVLRKSYVENLLGKTAIYNTYGPSETTVCASYFPCTADNVLEDGTFPIGHPVTGTQIEILNENLEPAAPGERGEICIFGEGVSMGYLDPSKNAMFKEHNGRRMYLSGDIGCVLPDGQLAFFGRKDEQVMILGKRVEPKEVESVLCQCDGVDSAVVAAWQDQAHLHHLKAWVQSETDVDLDTLRKEMRRYLTAFMIPETFVFVDSIPLNDRGKPDMRALQQISLG